MKLEHYQRNSLGRFLPKGDDGSFLEAVSSSKSLKDVCLKIGLHPRSTRQVYERAERLGVDVSHLRYHTREKHDNWKGCKCGLVPGEIMQRVRASARIRSLQLDDYITPEFLCQLAKNQHMRCAYSGVLLNFYLGRYGNASLERVDSSRGYEVGNVCWIASALQSMKMDKSLQDFVSWCMLVSKNFDYNSSDNSISRRLAAVAMACYERL